MSKIAIFTIATNKYSDYWWKMVKSADRFLFVNDELTFHVFTEKNLDLNRLHKKLKRSKVVVHKIPNLQWPHATLYRYKYIAKFGNGLSDDFIMHIDADMIVVPHRGFKISEFLSNHSVALVRHPGYWRDLFPINIYFYIVNPVYIYRDAKLFIKYGNLGTWSKSKNSRAFISRAKRKEYFCGAVWFGRKKNIVELAQELDNLTDLDLRDGTTPIWNDESYLNYWATNNEKISLQPSFCFAENYKNLLNVEPFIIALEKDKNAYK